MTDNTFYNQLHDLYVFKCETPRNDGIGFWRNLSKLRALRSLVTEVVSEQEKGLWHF